MSYLEVQDLSLKYCYLHTTRILTQIPSMTPKISITIRPVLHRSNQILMHDSVISIWLQIQFKHRLSSAIQTDAELKYTISNIIEYVHTDLLTARSPLGRK